MTSQLLNSLYHILYSRISLILVILLCIGSGLGISNLLDLTTTLVKVQAEQSAAHYANIIEEASRVYTMEVIDRLEENKSVIMSHDYSTIKGAIPVPSTFEMKLGWNLSNATEDSDVNVKVFSDYPWEGGNSMLKVQNQDQFQGNALEEIQKMPTQPYIKIEKIRGIDFLRFVKAKFADTNCVSCHNTHPNSPKKDWRVGDVIGVIEVDLPLNKYLAIVQTSLNKTFSIFGIVLGIASAGILLVIKRLRHTSYELERKVAQRTLQIQEANHELSVERKKSDRLLFNTLPKPIANRLKQGEDNIANWFNEATVLFADIVGFTPLSNQISPENMVKYLNEIFSALDKLTERHGLEKIRTIGDNYMVAAGVPIQRPDHVEAIAEMALGIQEEIVRFNVRNGTTINMRIGINTGPLIGGVVGTKKPLYDIWGDTVNIASRMESHGLPGHIQVTQVTYDVLKHHYLFQHRGVIQVKGKGEMKTYLLLAKKDKDSIS